MPPLLRILFVVLIAYPVTLLLLGINVRHRERLPLKGPAIVAANHNSHLDILVLYSLFALRLIPRVRPAAAADYFLKHRWLAWFSRNVVGVVPVARGGARRGHDPLEGCYAALARGEVLIVFPEGTRGEPERMAQLKSGIWYLVKRFQDVAVTPVCLHGLGRSMPKGSFLPLPLFVDVFVGKPLVFHEDKHEFMKQLNERFTQLRRKTAPTAEPSAEEKHHA